MMECGCDALAAHAWFKSFDLLHQPLFAPPARRASQDLSPTANSFKRRQAMVVAASSRSALQALQVLVQCSENGGNIVHPPIVAQLYSTEDFAAPQHADVAWTRRVRGVSLQVASLEPPHRSAPLTLQQLGWSDWRLTRVQFVTDEAAAAAAAEESQTRQKKQTSDGMLLWLPLQAHQVIGSSPSSRCSRIV